MHMADALISPPVGGTMWAVTAGLIAYSIKKIKNNNELDDKKVPLMAVLGAFIFAVQMINFAIPGTGSSGHLGGGLLLAILLGPYAGFLTIASVLIIQALFFADGGLLALGCNIFNLGFFTCFIAYPLVFKRFIKNNKSVNFMLTGAVLGAVIGLQMGAFGVVLETLFSGKTELPFKSFVLLMQPIHFAIGIVEGGITSAVVLFIYKTRPDIIDENLVNVNKIRFSFKKVFLVFLAVTLITGAVFSWFASSDPDGLEWAIFNSSGQEELQTESSAHKYLAHIQDKIALLPDYSFRNNQNDSGLEEGTWPAVDKGTSLSGLIGAVFTLVLAGIIGFMISVLKKTGKKERA